VISGKVFKRQKSLVVSAGGPEATFAGTRSDRKRSARERAWQERKRRGAPRPQRQAASLVVSRPQASNEDLSDCAEGCVRGERALSGVAVPVGVGKAPGSGEAGVAQPSAWRQSAGCSLQRLPRSMPVGVFERVSSPSRMGTRGRGSRETPRSAAVGRWSGVAASGSSASSCCRRRGPQEERGGTGPRATRWGRRKGLKISTSLRLRRLSSSKEWSLPWSNVS